MRTNNESITPSIGETMATIIEAALIDMKIQMPAKIVTYDKDKQYASVQPQLMQKYENGTLLKMPVIPNVTVVHPRANGGKAFVHMPLKAGDDVMLVFSHRSLDNWKTMGGMSDPADRRKFHASDAVAYVGGSAIPHAFAPTTDDSIEIVNDKAMTIIHPDGKQEMLAGDDMKVTVFPDGTISVENAANELIDVLDQITTKLQDLTQTLATDTVNTVLGPRPLNAFAHYATLATQLSVLLVKLESFKVA